MLVAPSNGPIYHAAEFFFLYAGVFGDTVFIRISLILAQLLVFLWTVCGTPEWPYFTSESAAFHPDAFVWCGLCIVVAAVPLWQQLTYKDSDTELDCGSMTHMAEAMWRDWFRRSGIPRSDFKKVLDCGEWVELFPGSSVPMFSSMNEAAAAANDQTSYGDVYYYVVDGCLDCKSHYKEGDRTFMARPGSFVDAMHLIGLLGQPTAALAMQMGPLDIKVSLTSTFSLIVPIPQDGSDSPRSTSPNPALPMGSLMPGSASPRGLRRASSGLLGRSRSGQMRRSPSAEFAKRGALLLRFRRKDLLEQVLCAKGLASSALRLIVTQSTLDNLFCESITVCQPAVRHRYEVIHDMRRRLNNSPLPVNSADNKHSIWKQWLRAHGSIFDLWRPGPEQRAMNATRLATTERAELEELRVHESELERLRQVGTPLSSPHSSKNNLAMYGGSHSSSVEDMSGINSGSSSPVFGAAGDPLGREGSGSNLATLGEEPEASFIRQTSGTSIVLHQAEATPHTTPTGRQLGQCSRFD